MSKLQKQNADKGLSLSRGYMTKKISTQGGSEKPNMGRSRTNASPRQSEGGTPVRSILQKTLEAEAESLIEIGKESSQSLHGILSEEQIQAKEAEAITAIMNLGYGFSVTPSDEMTRQD